MLVVGGTEEPLLHAPASPYVDEPAGGAVGGNHDALVLVDQRVERVEEFVLRRILAGDELDIVDHQHVDRTEQFLEIHDLLVTQRLDEAVHELLGRQVKDAQLGLAGNHLVRDGMHQVGLAQTDAAIKEQRVKRHRAAFGHSPRGGMGQFVRLAHDEGVEGEARIERRTRQVGLVAARGRGNWSGLARLAGDLGDRHRANPRHHEFDAIDLGPGLHQMLADLFGIVARHPVAHEIRGYIEPGDARIQADQVQGFDPGREGVLAHRLSQFRLRLPPGVVRHFILAHNCLCPNPHGHQRTHVRIPVLAVPEHRVGWDTRHGLSPRNHGHIPVSFAGQAAAKPAEQASVGQAARPPGGTPRGATPASSPLLLSPQDEVNRNVTLASHRKGPQLIFALDSSIARTNPEARADG